MQNCLISTLRLRLVILIVSIMFSLYAHAQETSEQPNVELKKFKSWSVQCVRDDDGLEKVCVLFYQLVAEGGRRALSLQVQEVGNVQPGSEAGYIAVLTVPLGVHLPSGLRVQVDQRDPVDLPYERCDQGGCYAGITMGEAFTEALKKGKECIVLFNNINGKTVRAKIPLDGFTAGYNALRS